MLKENFKDEIPQGGKRKYGIRDNLGNYIYRDVEIVRTNGNTQDGDRYGAAEVNEERSAINQLSNPNLLINGDFQVWQRGTEFLPKYDNYICYSADRWISVLSLGTTITQSDLGVTISKTKANRVTVRQYIELNSISRKLYENKKLTLSVKYQSSVDVKFDIVVGVQRKTVNIVKGYSTIQETFTLTSDDIRNQNNTPIIDCMIFDNTSDICNVDILWAKLELGEVATPLVSKPYGEELMLCQRYREIQLVTQDLTDKSTNTTGYILAVFSPKVEKRTKPTFTIVDTLGNVGYLSRYDTRFGYTKQQARIYSGYGDNQTYELISDKGESACSIKAIVVMDAEIY